MGDRKILFVCTANVFRSFSAEYLLKHYLRKNRIRGYSVSSAGTVAFPESLSPVVLSALDKCGVSSSRINHLQRRVDEWMVRDADVIICFEEAHRRVIEGFGLGKPIFLFEELAFGRSSETVDASFPKGQHACVLRIRSGIPQLFLEVKNRFFLFEDFVKGRKHHLGDIPFVPLAEECDALAFMSVDIPTSQDGHVLVIPKKRYVHFHDIPLSTLNQMNKLLRRVCKAFLLEHGGYNLLLNNGVVADQSIFHTHYHIIPRSKGDGIKIELWGRRRVSRKKFVEYNDRLRKLLSSIK
jgi:histidine triad (HIT) family protein